MIAQQYSLPRRKRLAISVVSHSQGAMIQTLLDDLRKYVNDSVEVFVTLNLPEPEDFVLRSSVPVEILRNAAPKGFGANHNQALSRSNADFFLVLNPDVRLRGFDIKALLRTLEEATLAACSPLVLNPLGQVEDNARRFPTPGLILGRVAQRLRGLTTESDYPLRAQEITRVEWVAGMCMMFKANLYRQVGGFDERYFMYLEDADICRRLMLAGYGVAVNSKTEIVHDAQRATLRSATHLRWHAASMARFLVGSLILSLSRGRRGRT